jgi:hypothetical protein
MLGLVPGIYAREKQATLQLPLRREQFLGTSQRIRPVSTGLVGFSGSRSTDADAFIFRSVIFAP